MRVLTLIAAAVLAMPVAAREAAFDPVPILACLADQDSTDSCVGAGAQACIDVPVGGEVTERLIACHQAEYQWWEGLLQADTAELLADEIAGDQIIAESARFSGRPPAAPLLEGVLEHFTLWRDGLCAYEALQFWGIEAEPYVLAECLMRLTGDQVLTLRRIAAGGG